MNALSTLLTRTPHVLLDFDGPVCAVFGGTSDHAVADQLRAGLAEVPEVIVASSDPFDVLRYAATRSPSVLARIAREFTDLEVRAVATATPTPGAAETIAALRRSGHTVTIVSNNSAAAVIAYLDAHGLAALVDGVSARTAPSPDLLKPNPHLLHGAIAAVGTRASQCVLIGDSTTDVIAAHAAGTTVIGYANKPGKHEQFHALDADVIVDSMFTVADAAAAPASEAAS